MHCEKQNINSNRGLKTSCMEVGSSKNPIENALPLHFASHVQVGKFCTAPQTGTQHEKQKALVVPVTQFEIKTPHSIQIWYVFHLFVSRSGPMKMVSDHRRPYPNQSYQFVAHAYFYFTVNHRF